MKIFKDRQAAGKLLAKNLKSTKADIVLGIPRGGVVVAAEIAKELKLPLDIVVVRKIGAPGHEELALGAVDPDGEVIWDDELLSQFKYQTSNIKHQIEQEWKELKRREDVYRVGKDELKVEDKTVVLVDDGIATGATTQAAIKYLKRHKANIILAVPVASLDSLDKLKSEVDDLVVLEIPQSFGSVGQFYSEFLPVSDEEVILLLNHGS